MNKRSPITTHILDVSRGKPASGIQVSLEIQTSNSSWKKLAHSQTNADGRIENLLAVEAKLEAGVYRLNFETKPYFEAQSLKSFYPLVAVVFEVASTQEHYHVPLLLSPFGYSTYRGT